MTVDARSSGRPAHGDSSNALPQLWGRRGLWQIRLRWAVAPLMVAGVWIAEALGFELRAAPILLIAARQPRLQRDLRLGLRPLGERARRRAPASTAAW